MEMFPWSDPSRPHAERRRLLAAALAAGDAAGWLAERFPGLPDDDVAALAARLGTLDPDDAAAWAATVSPAVVRAAFAWTALDPSIPAFDRPRYALRAASLGKHLTPILTRLAAAARPDLPQGPPGHLGPGEHAAAAAARIPAAVAAAAGVPVTALAAAADAGVPPSAIAATVAGFSIHDATMGLPDAVSDDTPAGLPAWLATARLPHPEGDSTRARADMLLERVRLAVGAYGQLAAAGQTAPPSVSGALLAADRLGLPCAADSRFADAFLAARANRDDYQDTYDVYLRSFSTPAPPLPRGLYTGGGLTGRFLARSDPAGLLLGEATNCCQHVGGAGEDSAVHGQTHPRGGFFAVTDDRGQTVAQSWVWCDGDGAWCFDNIEAPGEPSDARLDAVRDIYTQAAAALADVLNTQVSVGTGYTRKRLYKRLPKAGTPADTAGLGYTDADGGQRLLAGAPRPDGPSGRPGADGGMWHLPGGQTVDVSRFWDGTREHPTTWVRTLDGPVDDEVAGFAAMCSGTDELAVTGPDGGLAEWFPADEGTPPVAGLVGVQAAGRAAGQGKAAGLALGFPHLPAALRGAGLDDDTIAVTGPGRALAAVPPSGMLAVLTALRPAEALRYAAGHMSDAQLADAIAAAEPWEALRYAAEHLSDAQLAAAVAARPWAALQYAADRLSEAQFAAAVAARPWEALEYAADRLTDAQLADAIAAVGPRNALQRIAGHMSEAQFAAAIAAAQPWAALRYAAEHMSDAQLAAAVAAAGPRAALRYAADRLSDAQFAAAIADVEPWEALQYAAEHMSDAQLAAAIADVEPWDALQYAADRLSDAQFAAAVAAVGPGFALRYAADRMTEAQLAAAAAAEPGDALQYAAGRLVKLARPAPAAPDRHTGVRTADSEPAQDGGVREQVEGVRLAVPAPAAPVLLRTKPGSRTTDAGRDGRSRAS